MRPFSGIIIVRYCCMVSNIRVKIFLIGRNIKDINKTNETIVRCVEIFPCLPKNGAWVELLVLRRP
jgi:hypothetical protein